MSFRRRYIILALVLGAITAIGIAPWPIDHLPFGQNIEQRFVDSTGLPLTRDRATFTLLPSPNIELTHVTISAPQATDLGDENSLLRAPNIQIQLKKWPLLSGKFEADHVILNSPRIRWVGPEQPSDLWAMTRHLLTSVDSSTIPSRLSIIDGLVIHKSGTNTIFRRLNASLAWPAKASQLYLSATALWHGEPVDLRIEKVQPAALAENRPSPLSVRLSARPISFSFNGQISADAIPEIGGELALNTISLGRASAWLNAPITFSDDTGRLAIKGTARLSNDGLSMPDASIEVEGGILEGALGARITETQRILVSATLDTKKLDLDSLNTLISSPVSGSGWQSAPWVDQVTEMANDLDIRLSANQVNLGKLAMQNVAASILITGNKLELSLNQALFNGGTIKARLQIAPLLKSIATRITAAFEGVDTSAAIQDLFNTQILSGKISGQLALEGTGPSPEKIAQSLAGTITAHVDEGDLTGVDLANVLKRARQRPLATALDWRGGKSPFIEANAIMRIQRGIGELDGSFHFQDRLIGMLSGSIGIADRSLGLRLHVNDTEAAEAQTGENPPVGFPIEISGSWDYPVITPDIRMLIERSSITGPLRVPDAPSDQFEPLE